MTAQMIDFRAEGLYILKAAVHRRESHIAHLIQMAQLLHDHLADAARRDFPLAEAAQFVANSRRRRLDGFAAHRTLLERLLHAVQQLVLVEGFSAAIALDDGGQQQLRRLESREAFRTCQAFAAPANLSPFAGETRVDDLSLRMAAERTVHGRYSGSPRSAPREERPRGRRDPWPQRRPGS